MPKKAKKLMYDVETVRSEVGLDPWYIFTPKAVKKNLDAWTQHHRVDDCPFDEFDHATGRSTWVACRAVAQWLNRKPKLPVAVLARTMAHARGLARKIWELGDQLDQNIPTKCFTSRGNGMQLPTKDYKVIAVDHTAY